MGAMSDNLYFTLRGLEGCGGEGGLELVGGLGTPVVVLGKDPEGANEVGSMLTVWEGLLGTGYGDGKVCTG